MREGSYLECQTVRSIGGEAAEQDKCNRGPTVWGSVWYGWRSAGAQKDSDKETGDCWRESRMDCGVETRSLRYDALGLAAAPKKHRVALGAA